jgi:hypothetical protein
MYIYPLYRIHNTIVSAYFRLDESECEYLEYLFHHHHQPINVLTAGAQAFLMDYT